MTDDPLIQAFFDEATDLVADFEAGLLRLEESPDDAETLNRIFRAAHTLKGNSAMLGFDAVAAFTHALEDLLDQLRKGRRAATHPVVDALLASADVVKSLLAAAAAGGEVGAGDAADVAQVRSTLTALAAGEEPAPMAAPAAPPTTAGGRMLYEIEFWPPADLLRRGLDPASILDALAALGDVVQTAALTDRLPPLGALDPETCYIGWRIWLLSDRGRAAVDACFEFVGESGAVTISALPMDDAAVVAAHAAPDGPARPAPEPRRASAGPPAPAATESASIRVPVDKVDRLINLVGELVITQSMVAQTVAAFTPDKLARLLDAVGQMDRHARELHERIMAVRMVPIRTLFARFPRVVRDLAAAQGKPVVLEASGEDTELDKTVIERIGDPLTHLVRNAVDHGIEAPEVRRAAGKPETGCVRLEAYQQGGAIYVEISDDGGGLDRDRLVAKAVQQGILGADQQLSDEDAWALVFRPGLSTAEKITDVSGRGVGMDVVRRNVDALGGSITIRSTRGQGTTFRIKLPLTLAIVDGQLLALGDETFVLPIASIVESVRPVRAQLTSVFDAGETVTIRGEVLPLLRLARVLGITPRSEDPTEGLVVVVEHEGRKVAIVVDELLGQQQVVIKSLESNFRRMDGIAGATILGDGHVTLILDVPGLTALARSRSSRAPGRSIPV